MLFTRVVRRETAANFHFIAHPKTCYLVEEPIAYAMLFAETRRRVKPRSARPDTPQGRFKEQPIIRRGSAGVGRLAGKNRFDLLPHFISQHGSVGVHSSLCPSCPRRRSGAHQDDSGSALPEAQPHLSTDPDAHHILLHERSEKLSGAS